MGERSHRKPTVERLKPSCLAVSALVSPAFLLSSTCCSFRGSAGRAAGRFTISLPVNCAAISLGLIFASIAFSWSAASVSTVEVGTLSRVAMTRESKATGLRLRAAASSVNLSRVGELTAFSIFAA
ncbi:hypothetical protein D3C78_1512450 [compost metagenome]